MQKKWKITEFNLSPMKLMQELVEDMEDYIKKPDTEFLYDRIKFSNYYTDIEDYGKSDERTKRILLYQLMEDINILIQQYLRFGRRVVEKPNIDDNEIISFPQNSMPKGFLDVNYNTIQQNEGDNSVYE